MKKSIFSIAISLYAIICLSACAAAQTPFSQLKSDSDVSRVYLSGSILNMTVTDNLMGVAEGSEIKGVEIYSCNSKKSAEKARELLQQYSAENPGIEELIAVSQKNDETYIYGIPISGSNTFSNVVIATFDPKEANIILVRGVLIFDRTTLNK